MIYTSADKVPGKYEEVALLTSQGDYTVAGDDKFYQSFRQEAAKIGANGVIIAPIEDPTTGQKVGSAILGAFLIPTTMANRKTQATAIYVLPVPEVVALREKMLAGAARAAADGSYQKNIDGLLRSDIEGLSLADVICLLGPPVTDEVFENQNEAPMQLLHYRKSTGEKFRVKVENMRVSEVREE